MLYYNMKNFAMTQLAAPMEIGETKMYVYNKGNFLAAPALCLLSKGRGLREMSEGEIVVIDETGGNYYTVTRSKQVVHPTGTLVLGNIFAEHFDQVYENQRMISTFVARSFGTDACGIVRTGRAENRNTIDFAFRYLNTSGFDFYLCPGYGFVKIITQGETLPYYCIPVELGQQVNNGPSGSFVVPTSGTNNYTIYINDRSEIKVTTGLKTNSDLGYGVLIIGHLTVESSAVSLKEILDSNSGGHFDDQRIYF